MRHQREWVRFISRFICTLLPNTYTFSAQRLYPQLPVNVRVATKTTILPSGGGPDRNSPVLIRKGTGVGWSTYHMHRMTSLYGDDAREFVPERWENGELEKRVGLGYMPFHAGPRLCLGSKQFLGSSKSLG